MRGPCRGQTLRGPTKPPQQNQEQLYTSVNMNTFYDSVNCWLKSDSSHQFLWLLTWLDLTWLDLTWLDLTWLDLTWLDLTWTRMTLDLTWVNLTWRHCKSRPRQPSLLTRHGTFLVDPRTLAGILRGSPARTRKPLRVTRRALELLAAGTVQHTFVHGKSITQVRTASLHWRVPFYWQVCRKLQRIAKLFWGV